MANIVTYQARPDLPSIEMSNGLTAVFVETLSLAASALAKSDRHRGLAVWLASHDQAVVGNGVADFDVSELPWAPATFDEDKGFVREVIAAAKRKTGWSRLGYEPREDWVFACLDKFDAMIAGFVIEHAAPAANVWRYGREKLRPTRFVRCEIHQVYRHADGCVVCNAR